MRAGPSAYNASGGLGRQQLSERETLPQWRMGTERRFSSAGARQCAAVPGPGQAGLITLPLMMQESCLCMQETWLYADTLPCLSAACAFQLRAEPRHARVSTQGCVMLVPTAYSHALEGAHGSN